MKLPTLMINYIILTIIIVLFQNIGTINPATGNIDYLNISSSDGTNLSSGAFLDPTSSSTTALWWQTIYNPDNWSTGVFTLFAFILAGLVGYGIYATFTNSYPSDTFIFSPFFVVTVGLALVPIYLSNALILAELTPIMCNSLSHCMLPNIISIIVGALLFIPWLFACIRHWRTGTE